MRESNEYVKALWLLLGGAAAIIALFLIMLLSSCVTVNKYYQVKRDTVVIYKDKPCIQYANPPYYNNMLPFIHIDTLPKNYINLLGSGRLVIDTTDGRVLKDTLILK